MKKQILTVLLLCLLLTVTLLLVACNDTGDTQTPDEPGNTADTGNTSAPTPEEPGSSAGADDSGNTQPPSDIKKASEGLQYTFADDGSGYIVAGIGTCSDSEIVIPAVYQDKPVVKLANGLFRGKTYITGVILPNSLTDIGDSAFCGCASLTSIAIPDGVTSIGISTFSGCTSLTSITIPDSVTSIRIGAFDNCPIESATIPSFACSYIDKKTLKTVVITNGTDIENYAFSGCTSLTSITIPNSVMSVGESAINSERDFRKTQQKTPNNIENSLQMIA